MLTLIGGIERCSAFGGGKLHADSEELSHSCFLSIFFEWVAAPLVFMPLLMDYFYHLRFKIFLTNPVCVYIEQRMAMFVCGVCGNTH